MSRGAQYPNNYNNTIYNCEMKCIAKVVVSAV